MNSYDALKLLIDNIQSLYSEVTRIWEQQRNSKINLKKRRVCDIDRDETIYKNIMEYVNFLNEQAPDIAMKLSSVCLCEVRSRVKIQNSIELKIHNYKTLKHESGKVPLNKCVNDLYGIRVILNSPLLFDDVDSFINKQYEGKYRCIDSSKLDYKATHIYFKKNNYTFPWELQIWNECDRKSNLASHKKYKQGYTSWEKESKEGGITND